ncbi:hypothetical protein GCM10009639_28050 [Kitasatospora putterlickiae]|uniref:Alpha-amylase n=1 Tax=Kitasatospora putterlickiae TaxID=221725 RepID=A0ABN1Y256_9ACTN
MIMRRGSAGVRGRVLDTGGLPVGGAHLTVVDHDGRQLDEGTADQDGRYDLAVPDAGQYVLLVGARGHLPQVAEVEVSSSRHCAEVTVRLPEATMVRGAVRDDWLRMPVPEALVLLMDEAGEVVGSTRTSAEGRYELRGLCSGSYRLVAVHRAHEPVTRPLDITGRQPVLVDMELPRKLLHLRGVVVDPDGDPVEGLQVRLADDSGSALRETTGAGGRFGFCSVPPGTYTLIADGPSAVTLRVVLDQDRPDVTLTVERGAR